MRGRPPRTSAPATRRIEVRVTEDEYAAIRRLARRHGCTVSDWLRLAASTAAADAGELPPVVLGGSLQVGILAD